VDLNLDFDFNFFSGSGTRENHTDHHNSFETVKLSRSVNECKTRRSVTMNDLRKQIIANYSFA
jgi:hypothetical protein